MVIIIIIIIVVVILMFLQLNNILTIADVSHTL